MTRPPRLFVLAILAVLAQPIPGHADDRPVVDTSAPVLAPHGMVVSQEAQATRVGVEILEKGGNAVDAAVAVGFAMAVTHPQAGNIGGGGFMLIHLAERKAEIAADYRETAPAATTRDIFLDAAGKADPRKSRDLGTGVGVPR